VGQLVVQRELSARGSYVKGREPYEINRLETLRVFGGGKKRARRVPPARRKESKGFTPKRLCR